jgi:nitrite reductase (NO-forming)
MKKSALTFSAFVSVLLLAAPVPALAQHVMGTKEDASMSHAMPNVTYTLRTGIAQGKMVYIGRGGAIEGKINPTLTAHEGDTVQIILINGEGAEHDIALPDFRAVSQHVVAPGASSALVFRASNAGSYYYWCTLPGHREAGMEGLLRVEPARPPSTPDQAVSISRDPSDLPDALPERGPTTVHYNLEAIERIGRLANGTTYDFWTFNGKVPGPMLRVRVGDTVVVSLKNAPDSVMLHNIDLHAVNGPGGGAVATEVAPGEEKAFSFKALTPGLYVYHCATPMVSNHISNGMYGLILVEPAGGLPKVDREFYVMQGELYTAEPFGTTGAQEFSYEKIMAERPEYFVFNGSVGALTEEHPLRAKQGDNVRIFFGVGGPNFTSSFHVIGTIFDRVYEGASLISTPLTGVQTTTVAPGGATVVELKLPVPGRFVLVDHALSRMERGLVGALIVDGKPDTEIFNMTPGKPTTEAPAATVSPASAKP